MSNVIGFSDRVVTGGDGAPAITKWLFSVFSDYIRSDSPTLSTDCFGAGRFASDLVAHGFGKEHAKSFVSNLEYVFLLVARTALRVGEQYNVGVTGLTYGFVNDGTTEMLVLLPVYEDWGAMPFTHLIFVGPLGDPGLGESQLSIFKNVDGVEEAKNQPKLTTKEASVVTQEQLDNLDSYFNKLVGEFATEYIVKHQPAGQTHHQKVNAHLLLDGNGFLYIDQISYGVNVVDLSNR